MDQACAENSSDGWQRVLTAGGAAGQQEKKNWGGFSRAATDQVPMYNQINALRILIQMQGQAKQR
jgi:hypothetical protein